MSLSLQNKYKILKKEIIKFPVLIKEDKHLPVAGRFQGPICGKKESTIIIFSDKRYANRISSLLHEFGHFLCYYDNCNCMNNNGWVSEYHAFKFELLAVKNHFPQILNTLVKQYFNILKWGEYYPSHVTALKRLMNTELFKHVLKDIKRRKKR